MLTAILTCYNRKFKTMKCIESMVKGNPKLDIEFIVVDDNSTDQTAISLKNMKAAGYKITVLHGTGGLYWSGGMRMGIAYAKQHTMSEHYILVNDDVEFFEHTIEQLIDLCENNVVVGAMCNAEGKLSYGGIKYEPGTVKYKMIGPMDNERSCDTFNANCVLMPYEIFKETPNIDKVYKHSLGDFDYGLSIGKNHRKAVADFFVGTCTDNDIQGTWQDKSLSRIRRLKLKKGVKGAPFFQWFYFLNKNFGIHMAIIHSVTPFIRIFVRK